MKLFLLLIFLAFLFGGCLDQQKQQVEVSKSLMAESNLTSFDSTCQGCQKLNLPFKRFWSTQFNDLNFLMPFIIHISFKEKYFEIVNNDMIESEIIVSFNKRTYLNISNQGILPQILESSWTDSTFYMIYKYFPYPIVNMDQPHPFTIGYVNKDISSSILKTQPIFEYHFFKLIGDTLIQYYFDAPSEDTNPKSLKEWLPLAMKIFHPIFKPQNKNIPKKYIIEYLGNKCMCKSSLVKVFDKNPIAIKDSPDSFY